MVTSLNGVSKKLVGIAVALTIVLAAFTIGTGNSQAGTLLESRVCSLSSGNPCTSTKYYTMSSTAYSRLDNDAGGSQNHCASVVIGGNIYGNGCSTSTYAYSTCVPAVSAKGRGSASSSHVFQLNFYKNC